MSVIKLLLTLRDAYSWHLYSHLDLVAYFSALIIFFFSQNFYLLQIDSISPFVAHTTGAAGSWRRLIILTLLLIRDAEVIFRYIVQFSSKQDILKSNVILIKNITLSFTIEKTFFFSFFDELYLLTEIDWS